MVDILNIIWDGKYAEADLIGDGNTEYSYHIKVDCDKEEVIENSYGRLNSFIGHARNELVRLYREGKQPKKSRAMWY